MRERTMWERFTLKENAKYKLRMNYWPLVLVSLLYYIVYESGGSNSDDRMETMVENGLIPYEIVALIAAIAVPLTVILILANYLVFQPLKIGCLRYYIKQEDCTASWGDLAYGFTENYLNVVKICFLQDLFTLLWTLCLVIPGIIKSYEYYMIPYILAEDANVDRKDVFYASFCMMDGNKWDTFVLGLSFIGWEILSIFTFGLLSIFYVNPYIYLTFTELYLTLSRPRTSYEPIAAEPTDQYNDIFNVTQ